MGGTVGKIVASPVKAIGGTIGSVAKTIGNTTGDIISAPVSAISKATVTASQGVGQSIQGITAGGKNTSILGAAAGAALGNPAALTSLASSPSGSGNSRPSSVIVTPSAAPQAGGSSISPTILIGAGAAIFALILLRKRR